MPVYIPLLVTSKTYYNHLAYPSNKLKRWSQGDITKYSLAFEQYSLSNCTLKITNKNDWVCNTRWVMNSNIKAITKFNVQKSYYSSTGFRHSVWQYGYGTLCFNMCETYLTTGPSSKDICQSISPSQSHSDLLQSTNLPK